VFVAGNHGRVRYETKEKTSTETLLHDLKVDREGEQAELDAVAESASASRETGRIFGVLVFFFF